MGRNQKGITPLSTHALARKLLHLPNMPVWVQAKNHLMVCSVEQDLRGDGVPAPMIIVRPMSA